MDEKTRKVIENAIAIRARWKVRMNSGEEVPFRANVAEDQDAAKKEDGS